jgi:AcrR family transcriptional regulator
MKKVKTGIRQAQIKNAALQVIARRGLMGLTISAIAERAGISCGNIYRHFEDKGAVIDAIVSEISSGLGKIVESASRKKRSPLECLKTIFSKHIEFLENNRGIFKFMLSEGIYSVNNRAKGGVARYLSAIRRILSRGMREGYFDRRLDVDAAARAFLGNIQGVGLQWILYNYGFSVHARGKKIWQVFAQGILPRSR